MVQVRERLISREEAIILAEQLLHKHSSDSVIRDTLLERGLSLQEANEIIQVVHQTEDSAMHISPKIMGLGLTVITAIILLIAVFLIISAQ